MALYCHGGSRAMKRPRQMKGLNDDPNAQLLWLYGLGIANLRIHSAPFDGAKLMDPFERSGKTPH